MNVEIRVLFFAKAREIVGEKQLVLSISSAPLKYSTIKDLIIEEFGLGIIRDSVVLAVNEEFCAEESEVCLKSGDEIAVIPPLSGG